MEQNRVRREIKKEKDKKKKLIKKMGYQRGRLAYKRDKNKREKAMRLKWTAERRKWQTERKEKVRMGMELTEDDYARDQYYETGNYRTGRKSDAWKQPQRNRPGAGTKPGLQPQGLTKTREEWDDYFDYYYGGSPAFANRRSGDDIYFE